VPAVVLADRDENAGGFTRREDDGDAVWLGAAEVGVDEPVPTFFRRRFDQGSVPVRRAGCDPALILGGDVAEDRLAHGIEFPVCVEEPDDPLRLLKWLDERIPQDAIEATVRETDAIVMMLVEGVHGRPPGVSNPEGYARGHRCGQPAARPLLVRASRSRITVWRAERAEQTTLTSQGLCPTPTSRVTGISRAEPLTG
jgi:hypothetical protein